MLIILPTEPGAFRHSKGLRFVGGVQPIPSQVYRRIIMLLKSIQIIVLGNYHKSNHDASRIVGGGGYCSNSKGKPWHCNGCGGESK